VRTSERVDGRQEKSRGTREEAVGRIPEFDGFEQALRQKAASNPRLSKRWARKENPPRTVRLINLPPGPCVSQGPQTQAFGGAMPDREPRLRSHLQPLTMLTDSRRSSSDGPLICRPERWTTTSRSLSMSSLRRHWLPSSISSR